MCVISQICRGAARTNGYTSEVATSQQHQSRKYRRPTRWSRPGVTSLPNRINLIPADPTSAPPSKATPPPTAFSSRSTSRDPDPGHQFAPTVLDATPPRLARHRCAARRHRAPTQRPRRWRPTPSTRPRRPADPADPTPHDVRALVFLTDAAAVLGAPASRSAVVAGRSGCGERRWRLSVRRETGAEARRARWRPHASAETETATRREKLRGRVARRQLVT